MNDVPEYGYKGIRMINVVFHIYAEGSIIKTFAISNRILSFNLQFRQYLMTYFHYHLYILNMGRKRRLNISMLSVDRIDLYRSTLAYFRRPSISVATDTNRRVREQARPD